MMAHHKREKRDLSVTVWQGGLRPPCQPASQKETVNFLQMHWSPICSSSRKGQLSARARTMRRWSCTTSEPTRSWLSTHTTTSSAGSPRWPLASPADYSWLDTMTLTSMFGTHSGLNAPVIWTCLKCSFLKIYFLVEIEMSHCNLACDIMDLCIFEIPDFWIFRSLVFEIPDF